MKVVKLVLLFGALAFLGVSCSNSETPIHKSKPVNWENVPNLAPAGNNTAIAPQDTLFTILPDSTLTEQQKKQLASALQGYTSNISARISAHVARLNPNIWKLLGQEDTLCVPISTDTSYVAIKNRQSSNSDGFSFWKGLVPNTTGRAQLTYSKKGVLTGGIGFPTPTSKKFSSGFKILTLNDGFVVVIRIKRNKAVRLIM